MVIDDYLYLKQKSGDFTKNEVIDPIS